MYMSRRTSGRVAYAFGGLLGFVLGIAIVGVLGCNNSGQSATVPRAEMAGQREAMDQATRTIRTEHKEWTTLLGPGGDKTQLPNLSADDVKTRNQAHQSYENFVQHRRDADKALGVTPTPVPTQ